MNQRYVFRMQLNPGQAGEYQRRHDAIWPELTALLHGAGISDYSIHLDAPTGLLIGVLTRPDDHKMDDLAADPIMQKWWAFMADIMQTGPDLAPIATPMPCVFYLP